jgi:flagellar assembly protein FliH
MSVVRGLDVVAEEDVSAIGVLQAARAEARRILETARVEARALREAERQGGQREGYEAGFREGREAGYQDAGARVEAEAKSALDAAYAARDAFLRENRPLLSQAAGEIAAHLYGEALAVDADHIAGVVERMLADVLPHKVVALRVSPFDLPVALRERQAWAGRFPDATLLRIVPDAALERGGCVVTTDGAGYLERDWPCRLAELVDVLDTLWREPGEGGTDAQRRDD